MKILVVGLGSIGQRHVRNLRAVSNGDVEILAYRCRSHNLVLNHDMTLLQGATVEKTYNVQSTETLDDALAKRPDAVFITNPTSLHIPVALAAAEAGCNLFIEKPLSNSLDGLARLLALIERKNLVTLVGYQLRFHPCLRLVKELLDRQVIGSLLTVRFEVGEYLPGWHPYENYRETYAARRELGGGAILSQIHELDLLYWWFGMPRRVFALGGHWSDLEVDVEDTASMLLECQYAGRPLPVYVQQDFLQKPPSRTYQIIGDKGKILVDLQAAEVHLMHSESIRPEIYRFQNYQRNELFVDELKHFVACLRGKERPIVSVLDGAQSLYIALAARRSIEIGDVITL